MQEVQEEQKPARFAKVTAFVQKHPTMVTVAAAGVTFGLGTVVGARVERKNIITQLEAFLTGAEAQEALGEG